MNNDEMKKVAIKASVFALVSVALMLHRSATKHIMITDAAGAPIDRQTTESGYNLLIDKNVPQGKENTLIIPLPGTVSSDNIVLEDGYVDHELRIYVDSREEGFYKDSAVMTDLDIIESAECTTRSDSGSVCLIFKLDGLYANESSLTESSTIEVKFYDPSDKFENIVVVDPFGGGGYWGAVNDLTYEKDITLETALLLKNIADKDTDHDIKLYFTRLTDTAVDNEKRLSLVRDSGADLFIQLSAEAADLEEAGMTAYYNDTFFLRRMTNAKAADIMLRNAAAKAGEKALGILPMKEEDILLQSSVVPSTRLNLGNLSNEDDAKRLFDEAYKKKLAEGIYNGIIEAFEVTE